MALSTNEKTHPGAQRIMALWFPHLPAERIMRQRLGRLWRSRVTKVTPPLVFSRHENNTQYVAALDAQAGALGLRTHIGIAEARAMHPSIEVVEADPQADARLLESLADWCDRYTPLVATEGRDGLFLDVTGCVHLFGGEQAMLDNVLGFLSHQGFDVRAALASTPGAAWAAARYRNGTVIPLGDEAEFIAPLPLAALRLDPRHADQFAKRWVAGRRRFDEDGTGASGPPFWTNRDASSRPGTWPYRRADLAAPANPSADCRTPFC
jgi:protein ImuB